MTLLAGRSVRGVRGAWQPDPAGVLFAAIAAAGAMLPALTLRANRIVPGDPVGWGELPGHPAVAAGLAAVAAGLALGLVRRRAVLRLSGAALSLGGLGLVLSQGARDLLAPAGQLARVAPAAGAWIVLAAGVLALADALVALRLSPGWRLAALAAISAALGLALALGAFDAMSVMQEYATRRDEFGQALARHLMLAGGSVAAAVAVGLPLGIVAHAQAGCRRVLLPVLSLVQTIPSLAMFGLMIPLLAWVAAHVPGAAAAGVSGIGATPALIALFLYALLPVVANTVAGLGAVPAASVEAARGMGMTRCQRLRTVELPLAVPSILTAVRIVLVQNIGLAVIAGLIGGGGFGTFVFQGLNQTAADLILLGALPTVALAMAAAAAMDALVGLAQGPGRGAP